MKRKICFFLIIVFGALFLFAEQQVIFIDPSHGGKDPGAKGEYICNGDKITICEKDIALNFSKKLYDHLKKIDPNMLVLLSRYDDSFVSLDERDNKAKNAINNNQDLYISIQNGKTINNNVSGFKIWSNKKNSSLANYLSEELELKIGKNMINNGVEDMSKIEHFRKKKTDIVIYLGFLNSENDIKLLMNDDFLNKCAECIAKSIKSFDKK